MRATALTARTAPTIRRPAELRPSTLALMHGPSFSGDAVSALLALADHYQARLDGELTDASRLTTATDRPVLDEK